VVLNSASRAPFMLVAEVLEDPCNVSTASAVEGTRLGGVGGDGDSRSVSNHDSGDCSGSIGELSPATAAAAAPRQKPKACVGMPLNDDGTGTSTGIEAAMEDVTHDGSLVHSPSSSFSSLSSLFVDALMAGRFPTNQIALPQQQACAAAIHSGFGELWSSRVRRLKSTSPYGHLPGWRCISFMVCVNFKGQFY